MATNRNVSEGILKEQGGLQSKCITKKPSPSQHWWWLTKASAPRTLHSLQISLLSKNGFSTTAWSGCSSCSCLPFVLFGRDPSESSKFLPPPTFFSPPGLSPELKLPAANNVSIQKKLAHSSPMQCPCWLLRHYKMSISCLNSERIYFVCLFVSSSKVLLV